jgi:WD40 repeat protein/DNA-binding SARP family transcriptional activator
MDPDLRLELLGPPKVTQGGQRLTGFITTKSRALFYYLAVRTGVHDRHTLASLLWPDAPETNATKNLRDVLSNLRRLVGDHLTITRETAAFRRDVDYYLDIEAYSALIERYRRNQEGNNDLVKAVDLYQGDFLAGFFVADSAVYEAWLLLEREQLQQAQSAALYALATRHAVQGDITTSLHYVTRLIEVDRLGEPGQQLKMGLLTMAGRRNEALAQYDTYCRWLAEEIEAAPLPDTARLYADIRSGDFDSSGWIEAIARAPFSYFQQPSYLNPTFATPAKAVVTPSPAKKQTIDWGDMPSQLQFFGRQDQILRLQQCIDDKHCRLIMVSGIGGVGKTALAAGLVRRLAQTSDRFEVIVWRSLVNLPPLNEVFRDCLSAISGQQAMISPDTISEQLVSLRTALKERRCLLVLDNFESVLGEDESSDGYRPGYRELRQLTQLFSEGEHGSCLIITSREVPREVAHHLHDAAHVRHLPLQGLNDESGIGLLKSRGLEANDQTLGRLVHHYSGNPLALKLVADTAKSLFGGDVEPLLAESAVFGDIRDVLDEQFSRLSPVEEEIIFWLAIRREPVSHSVLWHDLAFRPPLRRFIDALRSLYFRSLLEQAPQPDSQTSTMDFHYILQNVVLEYATSRLVETICQEIERGEVKAMQRYGLLKADAKEFIQESQRRLLLEPIAGWMVDRWGRSEAVQVLRQLLATVRATPSLATGYTGANILQLLATLGADLRGYDFSKIAIRDADLRSMTLQGTSFHGADLSGSIFRDTFDIVSAVLFTPDGENLVARSSDGSLGIWQLHAYQPMRVIATDLGVEFGMAISADGTLAVGGEGHDIRLFNLNTGVEIGRLKFHKDQILCLRFGPTGDRLFSSSTDGTIGIWDLGGQPTLRQAISTDNIIYALAVSRDGATLAAGGSDGNIFLFDANSGALAEVLPGQSRHKIRALAYSPDGFTLAAASEDATIWLWHPTSGEKVGALIGHTDAVLDLAFHPDGATLASGSADKTIRLWNWLEQRQLRVLFGNSNWVTCVAYSPNGDLLVSGGYDRTIRLWASQSGQLVHTFQGTSRYINHVEYSPDGNLLASATFEQPVNVWDARQGRFLYELKGHHGSIRRIVFRPDGQMLATSGDDLMIRLWEAQSGRLIRSLGGEEKYIRTLTFSPDGCLLAAGAGLGLGSLWVWEVDGGDLRFSARDVRVGLDLSLGFSPDGRLLAYSDGKFALHLIRLEDGVAASTIERHTAPINTIRFSPTGTHLATQDSSGKLCVWRLNDDGTAVLQLETQAIEEKIDLWNLVFSPDGRLIVFQTAGPCIALLDLQSGQTRWSVAESLLSENALAFTPDGSAVISAGVDGSLRFWDVTDGRCLRNLVGEFGAVRKMSVNLSSNRVAGSGDDGAVRIWDIQTSECLLTLRSPGPYAEMDITDAVGLSPAQVATLQSLGATIA